MRRIFTRKTARVAAMEFRLTAANKTFLIITLVGPFLIVGVSVLPSLLAMRETPAAPVRVAVVASPEVAVAVETALPTGAVTVVTGPWTEEAAVAALANGSVGAYIVIPVDLSGDATIRYVTSGGANFALIATVERVVGQLVVTARLSAAGFDPAQVQALFQPPRMEVRRVDAGGREEAQDMMTIMFTTLAFTMMLYMTILLYGQAIGRSVLTEKLSKTVEIMLSSLSPTELLVGKLLGKAGASLLQYGIWIGMAALVLQVIGPMVNVQIPIAGGAATYLYLVVFFLLAFFLYSAVYAAMGAASEDESHMGQLAWPVILFLVIPMVMIGATAASPDGTLPRVLSIFPLTSPIVMFQRLVIGAPAPWEVALSVGLLLVGIAAMMGLASRIFRVGILMTGKRFTLGEILRWLSYKE